MTVASQRTPQPHVSEEGSSHGGHSASLGYLLRRAVQLLMSKIIDEPISMLQPQVQSGGGFVWRGREHRIGQVGGRWSRRGRWWRGEGYRRYMRITTLDNMVLDLCYDELGQCWTVVEMMD